MFCDLYLFRLYKCLLSFIFLLSIIIILSVNGPYWIGYDDVESFTLKAKFINYLGIAGGMVWSIDTDDFRGDFHAETFPMLRVNNLKLLILILQWFYMLKLILVLILIFSSNIKKVGNRL